MSIRYLLIGAAISMGAVAIWSMHYIGNRAIIMARGERELQIQYNAAYTAASFFLPIGVLSVAFYFLGRYESVKIVQIIVAGVLTGSAVCGMHYSGQGGISNYMVSYKWEYVFGSSVIAVSAATVALGVFFHFKATWTNNWWKRAICASILAASVSGMHWVATVGTTYRYRRMARRGDGLTRQATVVIVLCFALGCCIVLVTLALIGQRVRTRSAHHAQQIVLASVVFDTDGKLMVTPEGRLPSRKIAKTYMERNIDEIFDTDHPVYTWIYRASHYWRGVIDLIPGMKAHLASTKNKSSTQANPVNMLHDQNPVTTLEEEDFGTKFKELFCIAATELADSIQQPLEGVGALFESILLTGTVEKPTKSRLFPKRAPSDSLSILEHGRAHSCFGRGQLLFLVRRANKQDAPRFQAAGFNFATLTHVIPSLAQSLEVAIGELSMQLHQIQQSLVNVSMLEPGVHIACFALRPQYHQGWSVLVNKDRRNLLPSVLLKPSSLESWQLGFIMELQNMTPKECYVYLQRRARSASFGEKSFLALVRQAISSLGAQIDHALFEHARFLAHTYSIPCRTTSSSRQRGTAQVMMFRVMVDAHCSSPLDGIFEFGSSRLFRAQQHVYPRSPDHGAFARQLHVEFAGLAEARAATKTKSPTTSGHSTPRKPSETSSPSSPASSFIRNSENKLHGSQSETLVGEESADDRKERQTRKSREYFGGIHVQRDISIDISEIGEQQEAGAGSELRNLGVHSEITIAPTEVDTFADELMLLVIEEGRQQHLRTRDTLSIH
ncbi:MAG: hypothetical protein Q9216_006523 [Gyalolechia sp. 2 TL-2023]